MRTTKQLNLFDLTMIVVSLVIGMGIFKTPVKVAASAGVPWIFFAAWIAGGIVALCGALTFAEIGSRLPVAGGYYKIFSYAYHPSLAFSINCIILVSNAASVAGVALIGAEYIAAVLFPDHPDMTVIRLLIAAGSIIVFYGVNLMGLKMSARTQNVLTIIKIGLVLLLISALFLADPVSGGNVADGTTATVHNGWLPLVKAFGICLIAVSFTYGGYQQTINFGGDVKNPASVMPKGIFLGLAIIIGLYLLINITYVHIIGFQNLGSAESIAAILAGQLFGEKGFTVLSVLLFLSVLAYVNVLLMSNPRVIFAMSEDGVLPRFFQQKNAKTQVVITALSVFAALCIVTLFYAQTFDKILNYTIFIDSIGMATSAATIFVLRKRKEGEGNSQVYKMGWYPLQPLLFIAAYLFVAVSIFLDDPMAAVNGLGIFFFFLLLFFILKRTGWKGSKKI